MLKQVEFQARRHQLLQQITPNSIVIVAANKECPRNGDANYRFRQNSNFYYLTGFDEPDAVMVLSKEEQGSSYVLFNRAKNKEQEIWHGLRTGQQGACNDFGVDDAYPIEQLDEILPNLLEGKTTLYYCHGENTWLDEKVSHHCHQMQMKVRRGITAPQKIINLESLISEMRLIKSEAEIELMRHVGLLSAQAHIKAMQACKNASHEYQLEAELIHHFMKEGCRASAYDSIVGSGGNACILHYTENNGALHEGDLVLIDAGGEYHNYAADITRTFPVSGKFTPEQKAIYDIVLQAQLAGIECVKPDNCWTSIQQTMVKVITQGLYDLEILTGDVDELIESQAYRQFYMHNSGHWLGLDVHDVGNYKVDGQWRQLQPGMVLTVEPGIYIQPHDSVNEKWWNIGVRIEDDILVTELGFENLTAHVPKSIVDIEKLMNE